LANDINLAGKQRMLTQRMAKDLLAIGSGFETRETYRMISKGSSYYLKNT